MKTGTGIFLAAILLSVMSMFEFEVLEVSPTKEGLQHQVVRYNKLTGDVDACIVSYTDTSWGSCVLANSE